MEVNLKVHLNLTAGDDNGDKPNALQIRTVSEQEQVDCRYQTLRTDIGSQSVHIMA